MNEYPLVIRLIGQIKYHWFHLICYLSPCCSFVCSDNEWNSAGWAIGAKRREILSNSTLFSVPMTFWTLLCTWMCVSIRSFYGLIINTNYGIGLGSGAYEFQPQSYCGGLCAQLCLPYVFYARISCYPSLTIVYNSIALFYRWLQEQLWLVKAQIGIIELICVFYDFSRRHLNEHRWGWWTICYKQAADVQSTPVPEKVSIRLSDWQYLYISLCFSRHAGGIGLKMIGRVDEWVDGIFEFHHRNKKHISSWGGTPVASSPSLWRAWP